MAVSIAIRDRGGHAGCDTASRVSRPARFRLRRARWGGGLALVAGALASIGPAATAQSASSGFTIPVEYFTLDNGLRVVLSRDPTAPTAVVVVDYHIGGRLEPKGRTGFAHLFEHLMFQGSRNLGKMEFVNLAQSSGGLVNGTTGFDFTSYFSIIPSNTLEMVLWAEADRMKGLDLTQENLINQEQVVTNELKVRVLNQPYGGFPSLLLPQYAYTNWHNAHNAVGDPEDLAAATLQDVKTFFHQYYAPNNAVVVVGGDFDPVQARTWIRKYFAPIPRREVPPRPSLAEPAQNHEKRFAKVDSLAPRPALALGYRMPERNTPEFWAMGLIDQILTQGSDSRLSEELVQRRGLTDEVTSNLGLTQMLGFDGPMLYIVSLFHDRDKSADSVIAAADRVIEQLRTTPVDQATIERAVAKARSDFFRTLELSNGFGRAHLLATFALYDNDPSRINRIDDAFRRVTPALILKTAREYLRPANRTILTIEPKASAPSASATKPGRGS
jgi:predicted Zn-dependent peptidase